MKDKKTEPTILFESKDILVVLKPGGLESQSARGQETDMVSLLKNYRAKKGEPAYIGTVHRLDRPVEGLLVYGKTREATAFLSAQLQKGGFIKDYLAVVCGKPIEKSGKLEDFLWKTPDRKAIIVDNSHPEGRHAVLYYKLLESIIYEGEELSLLEIRLDTGRFHQIRAQLAHRGMPIYGDGKYGNGKPETGLCLAAFRLGFYPPGKPKMRKTAALPKKKTVSEANEVSAVPGAADTGNPKRQYFCKKPSGKMFSLFSSYSFLLDSPDI